MATRRKTKSRKKGPRRRARRTQPGFGRRLFRFAAYWATVAAIWAFVIGGGAIAYYAYDLPGLDDLDTAYRSPGITVLAADGSVIATYGQVHGTRVTLAALPAELPAAVMATEDRRYLDHFGVDLIGLARAAWVNYRAGRVVQGGSTITQQIAKNVFLTPERSFRRKVQEALLAVWLETRYRKDELLEIYLNRVYLGSGAYGVEAAARRYFAKTAADLTLAESAMIAGLLKAPSRYAPTRDLATAQARAGVVLDTMVAAGYLSRARADAAKANPARAAGVGDGGSAARYFADWVVEQVPGFIGPPSSDLTITTTLDSALQDLAGQVVPKLLDGAGKAVDAGQAALVAMTPDGAVRAMVGGRDYRASQFNRATQARRQPGSAFKLFVYLAALDRGMKAGDIVSDAPVEIAGWRPRNYDGEFRGEMALEDAFARSVNTAAVRLAEHVGRDAVIGMARTLGITSKLEPAPSLALGVAEVSLVELTAAYASVANRGVAVWAHGIVEIHDREGNTLYRRRGSGGLRVLDPDVAREMDGLLRAVVARGTGRAAKLSVPAAGKTGTSQDFRDAWFVGYTPALVTGVWLGNDDSTPMKNVTGGGLPARLWQAFMANDPSKLD